MKYDVFRKEREKVEKIVYASDWFAVKVDLQGAAIEYVGTIASEWQRRHPCLRQVDWELVWGGWRYDKPPEQEREQVLRRASLDIPAFVKKYYESPSLRLDSELIYYPPLQHGLPLISFRGSESRRRPEECEIRLLPNAGEPWTRCHATNDWDGVTWDEDGKCSLGPYFDIDPDAES